MPKIPTVKNLEANTAQILNAARADIGGSYAQDVPKALSDGTNLAAIGEIVMRDKFLKGDFRSHYYCSKPVRKTSSCSFTSTGTRLAATCSACRQA